MSSAISSSSPEYFSAPDFDLVRGGPEECAVDEVILNLSQRKVFLTGYRMLEQKLPDNLYYHSAQHTHEVIHDAILFGLEDGLNDHELELLGIAALYHDLGFSVQIPNNEPIAAEIVREQMLACGYKNADIEIVCQMIIDTKMYVVEDKNTLEQRPRCLLSKYLCDADLGNLGTTFFLRKAVMLYSEISQHEYRNVVELTSKSGLEFLRATQRMIANHAWHTGAAKRFRDQQKETNKRELNDLLELFNA